MALAGNDDPVAALIERSAPGRAAIRRQSGSPARSHSDSPMRSQSNGPIRPTSGSPPRPAVPVFPATTFAADRVRARTSSGSPPPFTGALWNGYLRSGREERPRFERDSLRNRSVEGRPGSRKHRRWTRSVEIMGSLRKAMARNGEDPNISEADALKMTNEVEFRPSVFYRLMTKEGAEGALDALQAAEVQPSQPRQPRQKDPAQIAEEHSRKVRREFSDTWHFLQCDDAARSLLEKLEQDALVAFAAADGKEEKAHAMLWMRHWDGGNLETKFGAPPANEIAVAGLSPPFRKVAHQLARSLGLHSESREVAGSYTAGDNKIIAVRPPRRHCGQEAWVAPLSVAKVISQN